MYTKERVIAEKKCGIRHFDKAQALVGRAQIILKAINISQKYPSIWNGGWDNFHWAFYNAVIEIINPNGEISQTYNLDEVLTEQEIVYIKKTKNYLDNFACLYTRKILKKPKKIIIK
jgi:hypothetical protein